MFTLATAISTDVTIRQSRFVTHAAPAKDLAATMAFFDKVADPAASHNCWAWKLDHAYRFNDDGEPASTAGKPILAAIEGKNLCRVMVVVTRYFGGVKLGVGGLIRAYSGCAAKCLDEGRIIEIHPTSRYVIEAGFEWTGQVHKLLESCSAVKEEERFTANGVCLEFELRDDRLRKLQTLLRDATRGNAMLRRV